MNKCALVICIVSSCLAGDPKQRDVSISKPTYMTRTNDNGDEIQSINNNYQIAGPYMLRLRNDQNTGRLAIDCYVQLNDIDDRSDVTFKSVSSSLVDEKQIITGEIIEHYDRITWLSNEAIKWKDGMEIRGVIKGKVASQVYRITGLSKNSNLKDQDLNIQVHNNAPAKNYRMWGLDDKDRHRMWCVAVAIENDLNQDDLSFVKRAEDDYYNLSDELVGTDKYKRIKKETTTVKANIENLPSCGVANRIDRSEVYFDSLQGGKDLFPIDLKVVRYEQSELKFAITYRTPSLNINNSKPRPFEIRMNSIGMQFVWIPAGEFMMGSKFSPEEIAERYTGSAGNHKDECPQRKVRLSKGYWIGRYEVTQDQYELLMGNNPSSCKYLCPHCGTCLDSSIIKEDVKKQTGNHPADSVRWSDALEFCNILSKKEDVFYTLPTEAQWEYACRAGSTTAYHFGDDCEDLINFAWYEDNGNKATHPVGNKIPNSWGLHDMCGNVSEWCMDHYDSELYLKGEKVDPFNEIGNEKIRIIRGGCYLTPDEDCRSASRSFEEINYPITTTGLRIVCDGQ
ncbi:MAG: formylglycine-generating enzyme family protein [Anaerohalosphaera sp.]|nr:formylglycine-generating enzyme family protein [Anaerohalosphaera sp.]